MIAFFRPFFLLMLTLGLMLLSACTENPGSTAALPGASSTPTPAPEPDFRAPDPADFRDRDWVSAFQATHEKLSREYAFGAWKQVDWSGLSSRFLPKVADAQAVGDEAAYYLALHEYLCSIPDSHIRLKAGGSAVPATLEAQLVGGGFGMSVAELDDGRAVVSAVIPGGPAALAGITEGAEIRAWNGAPANEAIAGINVNAIPYRTLSNDSGTERPLSTREIYRLEQARLLTRGPVASTAEVRFVHPGGGVQTVTLTAIDDGGATFSLGNFAQRAEQTDRIDHEVLSGGLGYIQLRLEMDLSSPSGYPQRIFDEFQAIMRSFVAAGVRGIILDLRGNYGGADELAADLSGFFYSNRSFYERQEFYNQATGQFLRLTLSEKGPEEIVDHQDILPQEPNFQGPVVALVNPATISSGEGLAMAIARLPQGRVVGFHGTAASFGMMGGQITMPGGFVILYPFGRSLDERGSIQLDSKEGLGGIAPNPRVPKTEANVRALAAGTDVERQFAVQYLNGL